MKLSAFENKSRYDRPLLKLSEDVVCESDSNQTGATCQYLQGFFPGAPRSTRWDERFRIYQGNSWVVFRWFPKSWSFCTMFGCFQTKDTTASPRLKLKIILSLKPSEKGAGFTETLEIVEAPAEGRSVNRGSSRLPFSPCTCLSQRGGTLVQLIYLFIHHLFLQDEDPSSLSTSSLHRWALSHFFMHVRAEVLYVPLCPLQVRLLWFKARGEGGKSGGPRWRKNSIPPALRGTTGGEQQGPVKVRSEMLWDTLQSFYWEAKLRLYFFKGALKVHGNFCTLHGCLLTFALTCVVPKTLETLSLGSRIIKKIKVDFYFLKPLTHNQWQPFQECLFFSNRPLLKTKMLSFKSWFLFVMRCLCVIALRKHWSNTWGMQRIIRAASAPLKAVINGKQFFKVQGDQRRGRGLALLYESMAVSWWAPGSEGEFTFPRANICVCLAPWMGWTNAQRSVLTLGIWDLCSLETVN